LKIRHAGIKERTKTNRENQVAIERVLKRHSPKGLRTREAAGKDKAAGEAERDGSPMKGRKAISEDCRMGECKKGGIDRDGGSAVRAENWRVPVEVEHPEVNFLGYDRDCRVKCHDTQP